MTKMGAGMTERASPKWLRMLRHYLLFVTVLNLGWEILQLPLYTIWFTGSASSIAFAVLHCSAADALIAALSLTLSLLLFGREDWPHERFGTVALVAVLFGVGYSIYSEWHNTVATQTWAYSLAMPRLFGIGLAPLAQWLLIPGFALWRVQRRVLKTAQP